MAEQTVSTSFGSGDQQREPTRSDERFDTPPVDIYEEEQGLVVLADVPGADPSTLTVRVERGVLTLQTQVSPAYAAHGQPMQREFALSGFYRQFQLPDEVDSTKIEAELKHGVLKLRLPRMAAPQPRRIEVRVA
jgi:HSP20 family molecular chaperone IbpA